MEHIECAAIVYEGKIYAQERPARHSDIINWYFNEDMGKYKSRAQGFLTNHGKFVLKYHAEIIARDCGQLVGPIIGGVLTSEDLW